MVGKGIYGKRGLMGVISINSLPQGFEKFLNKADNPDKKYNPDAYEHCVKGDALRIKSYFWESIDEYLIAITHDESNFDAYRGMGLAYKQIGYIKSAIESLEKARNIEPFNKCIYNELGCCYTHYNQIDVAIKRFKRALTIDKDYTEAKFNLAIAHEFADEPQMAIDIYLKIIEDRPSYIAAYNNLASLYMRQEMLTDCIKYFKKLLHINPDFYRAYLGIAVALDKMNQCKESVRYYKKYMEYKPNSANAPYIQDRINEIKKERPVNRKTCLKLVTMSK